MPTILSGCCYKWILNKSREHGRTPKKGRSQSYLLQEESGLYPPRLLHCKILLRLPRFSLSWTSMGGEDTSRSSRSRSLLTVSGACAPSCTPIWRVTQRHTEGVAHKAKSGARVRLPRREGLPVISTKNHLGRTFQDSTQRTHETERCCLCCYAIVGCFTSYLSSWQGCTGSDTWSHLE